MKVKYLIELLEKANPDAEIIVASSPLDDWEIASIYTDNGNSNNEINSDDKVLYIDIE